MMSYEDSTRCIVIRVASNDLGKTMVGFLRNVLKYD